jgi:flagellin-like hook-associated protein FlgL
LADGEISSAQLKTKNAITLAKAGVGDATATAYKLKAGDVVTSAADGTVTVTAETAQAAKDTYDAIDALVAGNTVSIGSGVDQIKYTIAADDGSNVDAANFVLSKEDILSKIHDGDTVNVNGAAASVTVIGDIGAPETASSSSDSDVISVEDAYKKMAEELQKASSIGTDEDAAASVTNDGDGKFTITQGTVEVKDSLSFNLHVGADADMTNKITVNIDSMSAAGLGIQDLNVADDTGASATYAIDAIADAISKVSAQRSALGAVQNRLEHTINNLDNVVENTTSAESRIRDTDMAEEMVEYSKNNILAQAGQSMLAQANQSNQGVLSLLQ